MEGLSKFFLILGNRIFLEILGSWIRGIFFNVPDRKTYKKKSLDFEVIDIEAFKNRMVGLAAVAIVLSLLVLVF